MHCKLKLIKVKTAHINGSKFPQLQFPINKTVKLYIDR